MNKVLVTGGTGYIGSHTVIELLNDNQDVVIVDNLSNSKIGVVDRIEQITGKRPAFYNVDVRDKAKLLKIFKDEKPTGRNPLRRAESGWRKRENPACVLRQQP